MPFAGGWLGWGKRKRECGRMKFVRCGAPGQEKPAVVDGAGNLRDLSGVLPDLAGAVLGDLPAALPGCLQQEDVILVYVWPHRSARRRASP